MPRIQKGQKLTEKQKKLRHLSRIRNQLMEILQEQRSRNDYSSTAHNLTIAELNDVLAQIRKLKGE